MSDIQGLEAGGKEKPHLREVVSYKEEYDGESAGTELKSTTFATSNSVASLYRPKAIAFVLIAAVLGAGGFLVYWFLFQPDDNGLPQRNKAHLFRSYVQDSSLPSKEKWGNLTFFSSVTVFRDESATLFVNVNAEVNDFAYQAKLIPTKDEKTIDRASYASDTDLFSRQDVKDLFLTAAQFWYSDCDEFNTYQGVELLQDLSFQCLKKGDYSNADAFAAFLLTEKIAYDPNTMVTAFSTGDSVRLYDPAAFQAPAETTTEEALDTPREHEHSDGDDTFIFETDWAADNIMNPTNHNHNHSSLHLQSGSGVSNIIQDLVDGVQAIANRELCKKKRVFETAPLIPTVHWSSPLVGYVSYGVGPMRISAGEVRAMIDGNVKTSVQALEGSLDVNLKLVIPTTIKAQVTAFGKIRKCVGLIFWEYCYYSREVYFTAYVSLNKVITSLMFAVKLNLAKVSLALAAKASASCADARLIAQSIQSGFDLTTLIPVYGQISAFTNFLISIGVTATNIASLFVNLCPVIEGMLKTEFTSIYQASLISGGSADSVVPFVTNLAKGYLFSSNEEKNYYVNLACANQGMRVCFLETEGSSQCQLARNTCSAYSSTALPTDPYRNDCDGKAGGCKEQYKLEQLNPAPNTEYRFCFQEIEGSSQCQGNRFTCTDWGDYNSWTKPFRADQDNRPGGCTYTWWIEERFKLGAPKMKCRLHFKETEGSSQCQGSRYSITGWSNQPSYGDHIRIDLDNRPGGCTYNYRLECVPI